MVLKSTPLYAAAPTASTAPTAQRGWEEARWLGGYLINSALCLGAVELLLVAILMGREEPILAPLRLAARLLLALNLLAICLLALSVRAPLHAALAPREVATLAVLAIGVGVLLPLWLVGSSTPVGMGLTLVLLLVGAGAVRHAIVQLPHRLAKGGRADSRSPIKA